MIVRRDGQILKTKIVATMGAPRGGIMDSQGHKARHFKRPEKFWDSFLGWFHKQDMYMIDIIRLNMAFYEPPGKNERRIISWMRKHKDAVRNVALLGDLPGPKLRLRGLPPDPLQISDGDSLEILWNRRGNQGQPCICLGHSPVGKEDPNTYRKLKAYVNDPSGEATIEIGDADATLRIVDVTRDAVKCKAKGDGVLREGRGGMNPFPWTV